jgi:hypothetical protein
LAGGVRGLGRTHELAEWRVRVLPCLRDYAATWRFPEHGGEAAVQRIPREILP